MPIIVMKNLLVFLLVAVAISSCHSRPSRYPENLLSQMEGPTQLMKPLLTFLRTVDYLDHPCNTVYDVLLEYNNHSNFNHRVQPLTI